MGRSVGSGSNFVAPPNVKSYPYGLGGVGCLVQGAVKLSPGPLVCEGNVDPATRAVIYPYTGGSELGEYSELSKNLARTIVAWDATGDRFFMIMGQSTLYGALGMGWTWQEAQTFAKDQLSLYIKQFTKPKPGRPGKSISITHAMILDGGTHSSIAYTRVDRELQLTTNFSSQDNFNGWRDIMTGVAPGYPRTVVAYDAPGDPYYPTLDINHHRENRTAVEAYIRK